MQYHNSKKSREERIEEINAAAAAFSHLADLFAAEYEGGELPYLRLDEVDFSDPDAHNVEVSPEDWPKGLAEYLSGCDWKISGSEHNALVSGLEAYWKLPETWGVYMDEQQKSFFVGWLDDPECRAR